MKATAPYAWLVLSEGERHAFLEGVRSAVTPEQFARIAAMTEAFPELVALMDRRDLSVSRLRKLLFGAATERTARVCAPSQDGPARDARPRGRRRGHGRHGHQAYTGARRVRVSHPTLQPGEVCPDCQRGKLRREPQPATAIRLEGQPPIRATVHEMEVLRCALCGKTFTAPAPPEAGTQKHDPSVGVMVGLLRYGSGMPFYRLAQWQRSLGVPLPASTQWELVDEIARQVEPVVDALAQHAAQAPTLHNDDTTMRVSQLRRQIQAEEKPARTGIFTTGLVAQSPEHPIALFVTGRQHAGENLDDVLQHRDKERAPPLQMCDGLARNEPKVGTTTLACCLAHGRRGFVEVAADFPEQCRYVLERVRTVYGVDAETKARGLSPVERLRLHQSQSQPVMEELHTWLEEQMRDKRVEPNSGLGEAIEYMLGHWVQLTRFLHEPGAPLDNNLCERMLKTAILHRKNSLSYKTQRGAKVGDTFMSLIQTCRLNRANPFDYFQALVRHATEVRANPGAWLPWNYRDALAPLTPPPSADSG